MRPEVTNAADPRQVRGAKSRERDRELRYLGALRQVLETPAGRLVFGELERGLIARAGVYQSGWDPSARIHFLAGRRDFGLEILALVTQAGEDLYLQMETEMRALRARDARETSAAHTARAEEA